MYASFMDLCIKVTRGREGVILLSYFAIINVLRTMKALDMALYKTNIIIIIIYT